MPENFDRDKIIEISSNTKKDENIIAFAEEISGKTTGMVHYALTPIFSIVEGKNNKKYEEFYYKPSVLSQNSPFPEKKVTSKIDFSTEFSKLWNEFFIEVKSIKAKDPEIHIKQLYYILKKYTSYVPSYSDKSNVSYFDLLKVRTAIAVCLYQIENKEKPFLIIEGDFSGIQNFIFNIQSSDEARKGMSKRLRGRSFWLTLLSESIVAKIVEGIGISEMNVLWNTGGHFLIIAQNNNQNISKLIDLKKQINEELIKSYNFELFLSINSLECSEEELHNFSSLKSQISVENNILKRQKFIDQIKDIETYKFAPIPNENTKISQHCPVCSRFIKENNQSRCKSCRNEELLGQKLAKAGYIIRTKIKPEQHDPFEIFGYYYLLFNDKYFARWITGNNITSHDEIFKLNDTDISPIFTNISNAIIGFKFIGNTVPIEETEYQNYEVLSFSEISQMSKGSHKLGILKADVDNLGMIFQRKYTIMEFLSLSFNLELFFAGYLNEICSKHYLFSKLCPGCHEKFNDLEAKNKARTIQIVDEDDMEKKETKPKQFYEIEEKELCANCRNPEFKVIKPYITYSGGDDLFIVGPWDTIIKLAQYINKNFEKYCQNPNITISAGISIFHSKFPISRSAFIAEENLKVAKNHLKDKDGNKIKKSVAIFNECVPWNDMPENRIPGFNTILEKAINLENLVEDKEISTGFIYSLLSMWKMSFGKCQDNLEKLEKSRHTNHNHVPYLHYKLARSFKNEEVEKIEEIIKPIMPWIRIPVSWVSLRTR